MSTFADYYDLNKKDYEYKLKIAECDFSEVHKEKVRTALQKYDLQGSISYKKTPLQENPMDFPNLNNVEVYIADVVLLYPASPEALRGYLSDVTGINSACIAVYRKGDPRLADQEDYLYRKSPEFKDDYQPALGSDYGVEDNSAMYGDKYNVEFLKGLESERKNRKDNTVDSQINPSKKEDKSSISKPQDNTEQKNSILTNMGVERVENTKKSTLFSKKGT